MTLVSENILSFIIKQSDKYTKDKFNPSFESDRYVNLINKTKMYKAANVNSKYIQTANEGKIKTQNNENYILDILIGSNKEFTVYINKRKYPEVYKNIEYIMNNEYEQLDSFLSENIDISFVSLNTPKKSKNGRDINFDLKYDYNFKFYTLSNLDFMESISCNMERNLNLLTDILKEEADINKSAVEKIQIYDLSSKRTTICYTINKSAAIKNRDVIDDVYKNNYQKFIPIENLVNSKKDQLIKNIDEHISDIITKPKYTKLYVDNIILDNEKGTEKIKLTMKNMYVSRDIEYNKLNI